MKTYIHKKLGWKAVQHTTPEYYKIYKSEEEDCYTLRSSLEIEDSDDWQKQLSDDILRLKVKEGKDSGFSDGDLWDKDYSLDDVGEFTVLSYKKDGQIWFRDPVYSNRVQYGCVKVPTLENLIETPPADFKDREILKVRRESDGETFSVGDTVYLNNYKTVGLIDEMFLIPEYGTTIMFNITFTDDGKVGNGHGSQYLLKSLKKAYKVEDGYVCEGDTVYLVEYGDELEDIEECKFKAGWAEYPEPQVKIFKDLPNAMTFATPAETKEPTRKFNSTEDPELLAEMENKIDELSNKYEISLKFYSDVLALVEQYKNKIR